MNEVIAKCLKEQLRVMRKYLNEDYPNELREILDQSLFFAFSNQLENVDNFLSNFLKKEL